MIKRRSLPLQIKSGGIVFKLDIAASHAKKAPVGVKFRTVLCMPTRRLVGVKDLRGNNYPSSTWIFTEQS